MLKSLFFFFQLAENRVWGVPVAIIASDRPHYLYRSGLDLTGYNWFQPWNYDPESIRLSHG